jgi:penicillin-binding protein 2
MKDRFASRRFIIAILIIVATTALIVRLFIIQVVKDTYRLSADNNVLRYVTQYPARGLIYDRNGKYIVFNQAAYDLMVVPAQTGKIDTSQFCLDLGITKEIFRDRFRAARNYSRRVPSVFL